MMVNANTGLAQHTKKSVFGAIIRMIMAADIAHPTSGFAQSQRQRGLIFKQRRGPGEKRRRHGLVTPKAQRHVTRCGQQRITLPLSRINEPGIPTLAQAISAEDNAARTAGTQQPTQHQRGEGQIGQALAGRAGHALQRAPRGGHQDTGKITRFFARQRVMMHDGKRIAGLRHMHARHGAPGAAHKIQIPPGCAMHPGYTRQFFHHNRARLANIALRAIREANGTNGQAAGFTLFTLMEFHQFQGTTPNIAKQPIRAGKAQQQAMGGKPRFLIPRQDMDRHAGHFFTKCGNKGRAIGRITHRGGGQNFDRIGTHGARHRVIALHDGERLVHRIRVELPRIMQPAAKPQHGFFVEDGNRIAPAPFKHNQAHRIGTQIHNAAARSRIHRVGLRVGSRAIHQSCFTRSCRWRRGARASALPRPESDGLVMKYSCAETPFSGATIRAQCPSGPSCQLCSVSFRLITMI